MTKLNNCYFCGKPMKLEYHSYDRSYRAYHCDVIDAVKCPIKEPFVIKAGSFKAAKAKFNGAAILREMIFTRKFIHAQGLEFALASEWEKERRNGE